MRRYRGRRSQVRRATCSSASVRTAATQLWAKPCGAVLKAETRKLSVPVLRTKAACLRVCKGGPWLVVYPDGIWYGALNADKLRRILKEHIEEGAPIREWIAAEMPNLTKMRTEDQVLER